MRTGVKNYRGSILPTICRGSKATRDSATLRLALPRGAPGDLRQCFVSWLIAAGDSSLKKNPSDSFRIHARDFTRAPSGIAYQTVSRKHNVIAPAAVEIHTVAEIFQAAMQNSAAIANERGMRAAVTSAAPI
jgi:hypothetical protein